MPGYWLANPKRETQRICRSIGSHDPRDVPPCNPVRFAKQDSVRLFRKAPRQEPINSGSPYQVGKHQKVIRFTKS